MLPSAVCALSFLPTHRWLPSPLLTSLTVCLDSKPPVTSICSYCFPTCKVDIACLQISLTNIFETKGSPFCRSSSSSMLTVEYALRNSPVPSHLVPSRPVPIKPSLTNEVNILGTPTCARSSLFVTRSCQLMLKILLRQCREGVESAFLVAGVEGPGLSTVGQLAEHAGLVYLNMVVLLLCQYVCVVQCLGRSEVI